MKRALMFAYFFPPSRAAGTFRTLRFVRDLPRLGWAPTVITVHPATYLPIEVDPGLLERVPSDVRVHRTAAPPFHRWYKRAQERAKSFGGRRTPRPAAAAASRPSAAAPRVAVQKGAPIAPRLDLAYMLCRTPDVDAGWYWPALVRGVDTVQRQRPDVLYATGGPWTTFLVARDVSRLTGVPLVLDYRDPWTSNPAVSRSGTPFERLALRLERTVVRRARAIVANTDVLRDTLLETHGAPLGTKTVVIHNSYDTMDFASPEPTRESMFTFTYVGAMYDAHDPGPFLRALAALLEQAPELRGTFRVRLVGSGAPRIATRVTDLGLADVVHVGDPVSHAEAVRLQRAAHALLLFLTVDSERSTFVPSKLYEYVAANRPILAVTRGGALASLLRRRALTRWTYAPDDVAGIGSGVRALLEQDAAGTVSALSAATVHSFSGEAAAERLAAVFEAAAFGAALPRDVIAAEPAAGVVEEVAVR